MSKEIPCFEIEFYGGDPSKIIVRATNGMFAGATESYIDPKWLSKLADDLDGFPRDRDSTVKLHEDSYKSDDNWGICLEFVCEDNLGHCAVWISMRADVPSGKAADEARFKLKFEPNALDNFLKSLRTSLANMKGNSNLLGIF